MALRYTITEVSPEFNDWNGGGDIGTLRYFKFKFRDSDGGSGTGSFARQVRNGAATPPEPGFEFYAQASLDDKSGEWKFKKVQTPEKYVQYGPGNSGSAGSSGNHDDKMRSKEQCMRGEAIIAAAAISTDLVSTLATADNLLKYIETGNGGLRTAVPQEQPLAGVGVGADIGSSSGEIDF